VDARQDLASLIRAEAVDAESSRAAALDELADSLGALPKSHPTTRVLRHLRPFERKEFPNARLQELVRGYDAGEGEPDHDAFFSGVIEAIHPGMSQFSYRKPDRPWWATLAFSPLAWTVWSIRQRRKTCPQCAERVPKAAKVCRYCGYRFEEA
jgi:hypothetical protein